MKVEVLIEKDESGYYIAEVPALPGCFSQGKTLAETKANIKEAIGLWIEVMNEKTQFSAVTKDEKKHFRRRIALVI